MSEKILISASILAAPHVTLKEVQEAITIAEKGKADMIHIDVMDGTFVPQKTTWNNTSEIKKIKSSLPLDIHIMIKNPDERFEEFVKAGASMITFHLEAAKDPEVILSKLHRLGVKAGISVNPETSAEKLYSYLDLVDYILIMSVHPGKAGQKFIPLVLEKIVALKEKKPSLIIEIDGGINMDTISIAKEAGASMFVIGSGIYKNKESIEMIEMLRKKPLLE